MPRIHILPESLRNKIAAGEVVERPASVVKELIENSIDAGSTQIDIEVSGAGKRLLRVSDNGSGMDAEDAMRCFLPHCTSKIVTENDLYNIKTLGFRGEALASIAAVSKMTIITSPIGDIGISIEIEGGIVKDSKPAATRGTTVEVRSLFFNTPARLKFLKSEFTENHHILEVVTKTALCNETVSFYLTLEGSPSLSLPSSNEKRQRIHQVYGKDFTDRLIEVPLSGDAVSGLLFIGERGFYRNNKKGQRVFINNRPVRDYNLSRAIYQALEGIMPAELHPVFFIYLYMPPQSVDFNVHPAKTEVRFANREIPFRVVYKAVSEVFNHASPQIKSGPLEQGYSCLNGGHPTQQAAYVQEQGLAFHWGDNFDMLHICDTIVAVNDEGGIALIDYHAAHERVNYERLLLKRETSISPLLFPCTVQLEPLIYRAVVSNIELLKSLGIELEDFGHGSVIVRALPDFLADSDMAILLRDTAEAMLQRQGISNCVETKDPIEMKKRQVAATLACHTSIRGKTQRPDKAQTRLLINQLKDCENPDLCPHGRPTRIIISKKELLRMFKRL